LIPNPDLQPWHYRRAEQRDARLTSAELQALSPLREQARARRRYQRDARPELSPAPHTHYGLPCSAPKCRKK
jgi:hypothetical protein